MPIGLGWAHVSPCPCTTHVRSVGMVFMPNDDAAEAQCKAIFEAVAAKEGCKVVGWRKVPVKHEVVGAFAKATQPRIWQILVEGKPGMVGEDLEREMFILRKLVERAKDAQMKPADAEDFYVCTLGSKTIVYKARARAPHARKRTTPCLPVPDTHHTHACANPPTAGHAPLRRRRRVLRGPQEPCV
jgi:hypothetical protein